MTSKTDTGWGMFLLFAFIFAIVVAWWDYFTTPQAKVLPPLFSLFLFMYIFLMGFGEYLGIALGQLAKQNFITRGGLIGVYEKHIEGHSGMVTYYFSTYTRYLKHCNYYEYAEMGAFQRFLTFLAPVRMASVTAKSEKFEHVTRDKCDVPEGVIFYHGTLRKVVLHSFTDFLQIRLNQALKMNSELMTIAEKAKAAADAAAQGQTKQIVDVGVQAASLLENLGKHQRDVVTPPQHREEQHDR